mmetsp:Transcript_97009/g.182424  ORF Transcript_97009/g.182424 Transcript_97009/m.182424 type:complete len:300 (-) Transcript_97009:131-1030(-)
MALVTSSAGVTIGFDVELFSRAASWAQQIQGISLSQSSRCFSAGAFGGPLVVGLLTPQRNAMTLAAKNVEMTYFGLYRTVFKDGLLLGFRGGSRPMLSAVPQFTALGPIYLWAERRTQSPACGIAFAALAESFCTYSAQRSNAQILFNASRTNATERVEVQPMTRLTGPGFTCHVLRNVFAMAGIRLISPYSREVVKKVPGASRLSSESTHVAADLASSIIASTLSMPFNHMFSWASCTPELQRMSYTERAKAMSNFMISNYQQQGWRLFGRDLSVRISYTGLLFTIYAAVERSFVGKQ